VNVRRRAFPDYRAPLASLKQQWARRGEIAELRPPVDAVDRLRPALERLSDLRLRRQRRRRRRVAAIIAAVVFAVAVVAIVRYVVRARAEQPEAEPIVEEEAAGADAAVEPSASADAEAEPVAEAVTG
jgi:hypothetical protein